LQKLKLCLVTLVICLSFINQSVIFAEEVDPNHQKDKIDFTQNQNKPNAPEEVTYSTQIVQKSISPYQLMAGTVIRGVMITGINSDLPGQVLGQISENIYSTVTGKFLVIPQGSKIIGQYDSNVTFGQERVLIVWTRIIFPNGSSLALDKLEGVDLSGYAGFKDKVDNHVGRITTSVVIGSVLSAAALMATGSNTTDTSFKAAAGAGIFQNISNAATNLLQKNLNIQPTLIIRPGYQFDIFLNKDIIFTEPYNP